MMPASRITLRAFLGFSGDELSEVGRRAAKRDAIEVGKPRLEPRAASAAVTCLLSLSVTSADALLSAPRPNTELAS